jgi:CRP/FNR family cyclic AMP-dependent transcriptional regulator
MEREQAIAVLARTALFGRLDRQTMDRLAGACVARTYRHGQFLWFQGDVGDHLVVIVDGLIKVVVTSERGDEMVLVTLGPPETLGELALLDQGPRSASAVAVETTTVLMINHAALMKLIRTEPMLLDALLSSIGALVRRLTEQASDLVFLDLAGRVAKLLIRLAEDRGREQDGSLTLDLGVTQSDLAHMVGGSRPPVNRVLQGLAARGLISLDGRVIVIRNLAALRRRAGL